MEVHSLTDNDLALSAAVETADLAIPPVKTIALRIPKAAIKVASYEFPESTAPAGQASRLSKPASAASNSSCSPKKRSTTRLKPPRDIVKLADRLYYLLQPPLESLLASD